MLYNLELQAKLIQFVLGAVECIDSCEKIRWDSYWLDFYLLS